MAYGVIERVFPAGVNPQTGKNSPGSVKFADGTKLSTFDKAVIGTAMGLQGQMVEYTTSQNGQYTNLGSVRAAGQGAPPAAPAAYPPQMQSYNPPPASAPAPVDAVSAIAIRDLAAAIRELTSALQRSVAGYGVAGGYAVGGTNDPFVAPPVADPVMAAEAKLAQALGSSEMASAYVTQLKKKFGDGTPAFVDELNRLVSLHVG